MSEALNLNCPYKVYADSSLEVYSFTTDNGIEYRISFTDATYLFDGTSGEGIIRNVFSLLVENVNNAFAPTDVNVKATISCIITHFFQNPDNCILYICDSSDRRELARFRKFNSWFESTNTDFKIERLNESFIIDIDNSHLTTIIFHRENSHYTLLRKSYFEIVESLRK